MVWKTTSFGLMINTQENSRGAAGQADEKTRKQGRAAGQADENTRKCCMYTSCISCPILHGFWLLMKILVGFGVLGKNMMERMVRNVLKLMSNWFCAVLRFWQNLACQIISVCNNSVKFVVVISFCSYWKDMWWVWCVFDSYLNWFFSCHRIVWSWWFQVVEAHFEAAILSSFWVFWRVCCCLKLYLMRMVVSWWS